MKNRRTRALPKPFGRRGLAALALAALCLSGGAHAEETAPAAAPKVKPGIVQGMSEERLGIIADRMAWELERRHTPGAVMLIMRNGKVVYRKAVGKQDLVTGAPMRADSIFRIYSMTKPVTSVAVMMLWEKGYIQLTDPIEAYLPDLAKARVAVENGNHSKITGFEQPRRPVSIYDLLRHTSGYSYGSWLGFPRAAKQAYDQQKVWEEDIDNAEFVKRIGKIPLAFHPGEQWAYGYSTDILGRLVEVVSGQSLGEFFQRHIFAPLQMKDTGFWVPEKRQALIAEAYDPKTKTYPTEGYINVKKPPAREAGGGGLVSTVDDYARFAQMLLNGGALDGVRLLGPKTVDMMRANHLPSSIYDRAQRPPDSDWYIPGDGAGFGLGFRVRLQAGVPQAGSAGEYNWGGMAGTGFSIDPEEGLVYVFMVQDIPYSFYYRDIFKSLVYHAIVD